MIQIPENLFLDTNVSIGSIYELDSLNPQSTEIVNSKDALYYSYPVKTEIDKVCIRKNNEYRRFFSLLQSKLRKYNQTDFISQTTLHQFIDKSKPINKLSIETMHHTLERIWESFAFGENQEVGEVKLKLTNLSMDFENIHSTNKNNLIKTANYVPSHRQKDPKIINIINSKSLNEDLHGGDENILFDLHEYSKKHFELNLVLVSWDKTFIKVVTQIIKELSFKKCICLEDNS